MTSRNVGVKTLMTQRMQAGLLGISGGEWEDNDSEVVVAGA